MTSKLGNKERNVRSPDRRPTRSLDVAGVPIQEYLCREELGELALGQLLWQFGTGNRRGGCCFGTRSNIERDRSRCCVE